MIIPYQELSDDALRGIIEEYITREGTEHGDIECSLAEKVQQVSQQLKKGTIFILFDSNLQQCNIVTKNQLTDISSE